MTTNTKGSDGLPSDDPGKVSDHKPSPLSKELRVEAAIMSTPGIKPNLPAQVKRLLRMAVQAEELEGRIRELCRARDDSCPACEVDGVYATDGSGPYDCYACGKKATREGDGEVGDWLWGKLMDFCRKRHMPPAEYNDLFAIVTELRALSSVAVQEDRKS